MFSFLVPECVSLVVGTAEALCKHTNMPILDDHLSSVDESCLTFETRVCVRTIELQ